MFRRCIVQINALYWKCSERQNSTQLTLLQRQNTKTYLYKLSKSHWVIALFEFPGSVRRKNLGETSDQDT